SVQLRLETLELAQVLRHAVEANLPFIDHAGMTLQLELPADSIQLRADSTRLSQVFANLLHNAAKFSERGGRIWLSARRVGSDAEIVVRDEGLGIPEDMLETIFEMFTQVDDSMEKSHGGLGIGLCVVRQMVEMHGGTVEARSPGPGLGATFIVRLPVLVRPTA